VHSNYCRLARFACIFSVLCSSWLVAQVINSAKLTPSPLTMNAIAADPFDVETGIYIRVYHDLFIKDSIPIDFIRTQRNMDSRSRSFGIGSSTSYDMFIVGDTNDFTWVALVMGDGSKETYARISSGTGYADGVFENKTSPDEFFGSRISWDGRGSWIVQMRDGSRFTIQGCSANSKPGQCAMTEKSSPRGEHLIIRRDRDGNIQRITSPHGRSVAVAVDAAGRIKRIQDDTGNHWVIYKYYPNGCLRETWSSTGEKQEFGYDEHFNMISVHETGVQNAFIDAYDFTLRNDYDEHDRLRFQETSTGQQWTVEYGTAASDLSRVNTVTAPNGRVRYSFNPDGYEFREEYFHGNRSMWTLELERDALTNSLLKMNLSCRPENITLNLPPNTDIQNGEHRREILSKMCDRNGKTRTLPAEASLPR